MGLGGTVDPEGWDGYVGPAPDDEEAYQRALAKARADAGLPAADATSNEEKIRQANEGLARSRAAAGKSPSVAASMVAGLATGAAPPPPAAPEPTPEGEALATDLRRAAIQRAVANGEDLTPYLTQPAPDARPQPSALAQAWAARPKGPNLLGKAAEYLPVMMGGGGKDIPLAGMADAFTPAIMRGPTSKGAPPAAGPTPTPSVRPPSGRAAGAGRSLVSRMQLQAPPNFTLQVPPTPYADEGPLPASHPAVAKALEVARGVPSGDTDLDAALRQASSKRLLAGLTRAGAMAVGGGRGPAYDALDEAAGQPLQELSLRRADADRAKAQAAAASDADPASPQSQMARALVAKVLPGVEREPWFPTASYARLAAGPMAKLLDMDADLQKERIKAQAEIDKIKAKHAGGGKGGGKILPSTEAAKVGDLDAASKMIDALMVTRKQKTGTFSGVTQYLPGTDAAQYSDAADTAAQAIGTIFELGKLSDADVPRYRRMLPTAGDSDARAQAKAENLKKALALKRSGQLDAFSKAGYRVIDLLEKGDLPTSGKPRTPAGAKGGLGRAPASEADLSEMTDDELRAYIGGE